MAFLNKSNRSFGYNLIWEIKSKVPVLKQPTQATIEKPQAKKSVEEVKGKAAVKQSKQAKNYAPNQEKKPKVAKVKPTESGSKSPTKKPGPGLKTSQ